MTIGLIDSKHGARCNRDKLLGRIARQLFEFAKLEWPAQTEAFLTSSTTQTEKGYYSVFKHPAVAANKWREELDADVVERILKITCTTDVGQLYADA